MVMMDPVGVPMKYDQLQVYKDFVGKTACRISIDAQTQKTWRHAGCIDTSGLSEKMKRDISRGADHLLQESRIRATDHHYDAQLWPHMHPHGTGSLSSEVGSGGMYRLARNRILLIESIFRDNSMYAFWFLNRIITKELFFKEFFRRKYDKKDRADSTEQDPFKKLFGVAMPNDIPESSAWCEPQPASQPTALPEKRR